MGTNDTGARAPLDRVSLGEVVDSTPTVMVRDPDTVFVSGGGVALSLDDGAPDLALDAGYTRAPVEAIRALQVEGDQVADDDEDRWGEVSGTPHRPTPVAPPPFSPMLPPEEVAPISSHART